MFSHSFVIVDDSEFLKCFGSGAKVLDKYDFSFRSGRYVHFRDFGSSDDFEFGSFVTVYVFVDLVNRVLGVNFSSFGNMCDCSFDDSDVYSLPLAEKECFFYTRNLIRNFIFAGFIVEENNEK